MLKYYNIIFFLLNILMKFEIFINSANIHVKAGSFFRIMHQLELFYLFCKN